MTIKNKRILVTGGAGFIGSNLCEDFLKNNNNVVCLDNLLTGKKENIKEFESNKNFKFVLGDIRDPNICKQTCDGIDYIFHHAALGSVPRSIENPIQTNDININGFLNILIAARDSKVKRFIYATSSSVYGDSPDLPKTEDVIGNPLSPYAITKLTNELYAKNFNKLFNIETIGLRYFNVFGGKQDPNGHYAAVIPKFIIQYLKHESPIINGDGSFSRDFTYIDNVIQINHLAAQSTSNEAINNIYNVAYGSNITINKLALLIKECLTEYDKEVNEINIIYGKERVGDIPHSFASIEKANKFLNYNPTIDVKDGINKTIRWYFNFYNKVLLAK